MMPKTKGEIEGLASVIVLSFTGNMMMDFPGVRNAVSMTNDAAWGKFIDDYVQRLKERLVIEFGSKD